MARQNRKECFVWWYIFLGESVRKKFLKTFLRFLRNFTHALFLSSSSEFNSKMSNLKVKIWGCVLESILFTVARESHQPLFLRTSITFCFRVENVEMFGKLSTSIYDLVLIYVCLFHHHHHHPVIFLSNHGLSRYSCLHLGSLHPRIFYL